MAMIWRKRKTWLLLLLPVLIAAGWLLYTNINEAPRQQGRESDRALPVEVAEVRRGPMQMQRTFSGTLQARAQFVVAPKISGRVKKLYVDLADSITRGQVVAELDDEEYQQAVARAEAELEVARANLEAAKSALEIARRELARVDQLRKQGLTTDTQYDVAKANQLAKQAEVEVARANLRKAESVLETSRIQLGYTRVRAEWSEGQELRVVGERYVDEGDTVSANAALLRVVEPAPLLAVIQVTEGGYAHLQAGQPATLTTAAYPGESFAARIERIAPVFSEATRQARVELRVENPDHKLKPGMFIRTTIALQEFNQAISVPELALTVREGEQGVFVLNEQAQQVRWQPVTADFRQDDWRRILEPADLRGRVVTLGQQFLDDGAAVRVVE
ncbi:efflux RND transporter periplasmic adaptor subunit [Thiohalophilus sp.]|uniref:efflux RND transporter periplasmic adaptor subunit n=1 Tax=Thiohalophilus sp. TaxID=3028392 RepID=UPI002ACE4114|nr:efflux RND transporter periplasmic adaptor subunit [Thiohalophilus sp.]MDZ7805260.1 efflux RND transporter periplasmic adaptor subunit [Thiohalophilus sp.]